MRELIWAILSVFLGACAAPAGNGDVIVPVAPSITPHYVIVQVLPDPYTNPTTTERSTP